MAMAERKPFLLRIDSDLYTALARWADDELRSLNGQIEFLLHRILVEAGRFTRSVSSRALAPRSAARKPSGTRPQVLLPTPLGRQPREARREPVSAQTPIPQSAARKPVDENPPTRRPNDDWDAMVD